MSFFRTYTLLFFSILVQSLTQAAPQNVAKRSLVKPAIRQVYEFPNATWVENLAIMHNGSILTTILTDPLLYLVDPYTSSATLAHNFTSYHALLGITETLPNVFAVIATNFSLKTLELAPGSGSVWRIDMGVTPPTVSKIGGVPQEFLLNGMDFLEPAAVLMSDSILGAVIRLNLVTGKSSTAIEDPTMKACSSGGATGINGLKIHHEYIYYSNADCGFVARIPIAANGSAKGAPEILSYSDKEHVYTFDDLAIGKSGVVYVAQGTANVITRFSPPPKGQNGLWQKANIAGNLNSTAIAKPTAVRFGRTEKDRGTLYVSTAGGLGGPINGTVIIGGQVVAIDIGEGY